MRMDAAPTRPNTAIARLSGELPDDLFDRIADEMDAHEVPFAREAGGLKVVLPESSVSLRLATDGLEASVEATSATHLQQMREGILHVLEHAVPGLAGRMLWFGDIARNTAPANLHMARVLSVRRVGRQFLRVELDCEGIEDLMSGGMHFTLLLPPPGRTPVWPSLDDQGRTVWPEGEGSLHRAAYTFVELDPEGGRATFDVFEHEGGRTTGWARDARVGETVAVMGPGGGNFPPGDFILLAGDETALPAIRRILEHSERDRRGVVLIECDPAAGSEPLPAPPGMSVEWIRRGTEPGLWERILSVPIPVTGKSRFVWIAAEQELARKARTHFRGTQGILHGEGYFASYWTA